MKDSSSAPDGYPPSSPAFEWLMGFLVFALISGLNLDIWAHNHGKVDESFFTPWHAVLYGSMALNGIALGIVAARNVLQKHYPLRRSLPAGYGLSLVGVIAFSVGGVLDLIWHTLFGIEEDVQALLSPTHILLAVSAALILTGPLRSAAVRLSPSAPRSWLTHGPLILSIAATVTLLGFFTEFAHPLYQQFGAKDTRPPVNSSLYITNPDGSLQTRLIFELSANDWGPAVSPDRKHIAYRRQALGAAQSDIIVANADGSNPVRITHSGRHDTQPAWSPDGREIAYISAPAATAGDYMMRVVPASAGGESKTLVSGVATLNGPAWSPDGTTIMFGSRRGQREWVARVPRSVPASAGGESKTLVAGVATLNGPAWSPDGTTIMFGSRRGQREWVASVPMSGGSVTWLEAGADGSWPAWRPDGKAIAFVRDQSSDDAAIVVMDAAGSRARRVPHSGMGASYPAWSADGSKIVFTSARGGAQQLYVMNADGSAVTDASRDGGLQADRPAWLSANRILFAGAGNTRYESTQNQSLGIGSFLLQTIVLMGLVLLLVRRWRVPVGALTVILTLYGFAMAVTSDELMLLPWIFATGVVADAALLMLGARVSDGVAFYAFAFTLPALYAALYEIAVAHSSGIGWPPNLILGTPIVCGIAGLLLAYAFRPPLATAAEAGGIS